MLVLKTQLDTQQSKLGLKKQSKFSNLRSRPDLHTSWDDSVLVQFDNLLYNMSISGSGKRDTEINTFMSQEGTLVFPSLINLKDKIVSLPQESINLEGILLQRFKEIEGSPESTLKITLYPVIFRPIKIIDLLQERKTVKTKSTKEKKYIFRQVNFTAKELTSLFVLQNMESDLNLVFEDCHFLNERYNIISYF